MEGEGVGEEEEGERGVRVGEVEMGGGGEVGVGGLGGVEHGRSALTDW